MKGDGGQQPPTLRSHVGIDEQPQQVRPGREQALVEQPGDLVARRAEESSQVVRTWKICDCFSMKLSP